MPVTQQELGSRIRAAREACRMTQEQVAAYLGVSRPTVVQIEAGNRSVSSLELDRLAHFLGRDMREFFVESFEEADALSALFRASPDVVDEPAVAERLRSCVALGHEITNLERMIGLDRSFAGTAGYSLSRLTTRWDAIQQGERLADDERRRLGLGVVPVPDMAELLEAHGIRTGAVELPHDVSGLTLNDERAGPFVIVNERHHSLRVRFSFAHEYAHVLADRERFGLVSRGAERDSLIEVRANAFAAAFLMPEGGVRQFVAGLGKGRASRVSTGVFDEEANLDVHARTVPGSQSVQLYDVVQLAHHFGVSRIAALYRLRNLRLITEPEFDRLKALDDSGGGRRAADQLGLSEPTCVGAGSEFHLRFLALALEAYRRGEISRGKVFDLASLVGRTAAEVDDLIADAGLDDAQGV